MSPGVWDLIYRVGESPNARLRHSDADGTGLENLQETAAHSTTPTQQQPKLTDSNGLNLELHPKKIGTTQCYASLCAVLHDET